MLSLQKLSWLIPSAPLFGAILIGGMLISFNRTMNRLTKPISFFLIISVLFSTLLSLTLFLKNVTGQSFELDLTLASFNLHFSFYLSLLIDKLLLIAGSVFFIIMTGSYYFLDRRQGYVRYLSLISALSGIVFFSILNGVIPLSLT